LEKHSNFVSFPVVLNNNRINTVDALWSKTPHTVSEEEHNQFYRFVAGAWDSPRFTLHYQTDAPVQLNALLYIPQMQMEKFGLGRQDPGVSLYSRRVLIMDKAPKLLPEWLRFVKGVVDSEDIPLNLSRELLQDSALIGKFRRIISARVVRFLSDKAKRDTEKYMEFYKEFGNFLREGACSDQENQEDIMKLMRYETSTLEAKEHCSLAEYVSRMKEGQDNIYYFIGANRKMADSSPYMEALLKSGQEVLYCYEPFDDIVFSQVRGFEGKNFVSVESSNVDIIDGADDASDSADTVKVADQDGMAAWLQVTLGDRVSKVKPSTRLVSHPAIISDEVASGSMRRMMRMLQEKDDSVEEPAVPPQELEVNFGHPLLVKLEGVKDTDPELAAMVTEQIFDNALVYAGLMDDPRPMLDRVAKLLERAI